MKEYAKLSLKEMSDSGQALALLGLILALFLGHRFWLWLAAVALVLNMASPRIFRGWAWLWLNFAHVMGAVVSRIILSLEFFLLVLPVGLVRRMLGKDPMAAKKWRAGRESVFVERNHAYGADDLRNPY